MLDFFLHHKIEQASLGLATLNSTHNALSFHPIHHFWCFVSFLSAKNGGFSATLYHIDGPGSPFYDPTLSKIDRITRAIDLEFALANESLAIAPNSPVADVKSVRGTYLMKLAIGTPPYEFFAFVDTGSEQTWLQCTPCEHCYPQNYPIFDPEHSSTYKPVECFKGRARCPPFHGVACVGNLCRHHAAYSDETFSKGVLSTDILTMQSTTDQPVRVPNYIFGCGTHNKGKFNPESAGIVGLGRGPRSLITQLGAQINGKFSYCLYPDTDGGKIHFGEEATVAGPDVITTPIFADDRYFPFYFATLEALTIGNEIVEYKDRVYAGAGNIIIDSGSTMTYLPPHFYDDVVAAVKRNINARPVQSPRAQFSLCFDESSSYKSLEIIAHFTGGGILLNVFNMFKKAAPGVVCLMIKQGNKPIWGYTAQLDFLVGYDVVAGTVSFKHTECR